METAEELESAQSKVEKELALGTVLLQPDQPAPPTTVAVNLSVLPSDLRPSAEVEMSQLLKLTLGLPLASQCLMKGARRSPMTSVWDVINLFERSL